MEQINISEDEVTQLQFDLVYSSDGKSKSIIYHRDIFCLLEQKKLQSLSPETIRNIQSDLNKECHSDNLTDKELIDFCKSRYINNLTDMYTYANDLKGCSHKVSKSLDKVKSDLKAYQDALKEAKETNV